MKQYSVGIPVRNEANTLAQCLESILAQTLPPSEILVCVNGSTDDTYEIAQGYSFKDQRIRVLTSNPGKPNAWNRIVQNSQNNYIMFADGDVLINPEAGENFIRTFDEDSNLGIVSGSTKYLTPKEKSLARIFHDIYETVVEGYSLNGRLYMIKLDEIKGLAKKLKIPLMPTDIINEDFYLNQIGISEDRLKIIKDAYALCHPINSFEDWLKTQIRLARGQKQIVESYPVLDDISKRKKQERKRYLFDKFSSTPELSKKLGLSLQWLLRQVIIKYVSIENTTYNNVWAIPETTKLPFR